MCIILFSDLELLSNYRLWSDYNYFGHGWKKSAKDYHNRIQKGLTWLSNCFQKVHMSDDRRHCMYDSVSEYGSKYGGAWNPVVSVCFYYTLRKIEPMRVEYFGHMTMVFFRDIDRTINLVTYTQITCFNVHETSLVHLLFTLQLKLVSSLHIKRCRLHIDTRLF